MARRGLSVGRSPWSEVKAGELESVFFRGRSRSWKGKGKEEAALSRLASKPLLLPQESRQEHASLPAGPADAGVPFLTFFMFLTSREEVEVERKKFLAAKNLDLLFD